MKAVILAGGEGKRLRPLAMGQPKAMTPLLGKPMMEHLIRLLRQHGITDIYITLCRRPETVMDYFGSGEQLGVRLTYFLEEEPLGTAGSVRNCLAQLGEEDFLVAGGGCVCDLDLSALLRFHRERESKATLALYRSSPPAEEGAVQVDPSGRVRQLGEGAAWRQGPPELVSTGIYILSPAALNQIPEKRVFDFEADLFPALLREGESLYGCPLKGYWREVTDCKTYLDCVCDALSGKVKLDMGLPQRAPGIWSADELPKETSLVPPCWIGPGVVLGPGSLVGPHVVLSQGAAVECKTMVQRSVLLESACVGPRATLYGAILCRGAAVRKGAVLNEGAVLGENALAEEGAVLLERVQLWPGQTAPAGCRLGRSITSGARKGVVRFGTQGVIQGVLGEDLGPEALLALGGALGGEGAVGLGCTPTPGAQMLIGAAAAGISAAGGSPLLHSLECPVQGAWAARQAGLAASLFVEEEGGRIYLRLFDRHGLPLGRDRERRLERALMQGELPAVRIGQVGVLRRLDLTADRWAAETAEESALGRPALRRVTIAVGQDTPADRALRGALSALGCRLESQWRPGIPAFSADRGGFRLSAQDEKGSLLDPGQLLTLLTLIEMENGSGRVAVPEETSAAVDLVAAGYNGTVLRLGRGGPEARALYAAQPWLWSAPAAAVRICSRMGVSGQKLEALMSKIPRFCTWKREVPLTADRRRVMQALARDRRCTPSGGGLRLRTGDGWVYLVPLARRSALRVVAEGPDLELAAELCDFYADRAAQLDREAAQAQEEK